MNPWMSNIEIKKIEQYLNPTDVFLEWGSGGSTLYFSKFVQKYISIEYDLNWYRHINYRISNEKLTNIDYIYCAPNKHLIFPIFHSKSNPEDFIDYVNIIDNFADMIYDGVLIDGRSRVSCSKKILPYLHKDSIVFVHDFFNRVSYHNILENYNLIDAIYTGQSLAILKKKNE
jgi:hypothetical protein